MSNMEPESLRQELSLLLPLVYENLVFDWITVEELMAVRASLARDREEMYTCRPLAKKNDKDATKTYEAYLEGPGTFAFSIHEKNGNFLGRITVFDYNPRNRCGELGYYILPGFRKKGHGKKAVRAVCGLMLGKLRMNKLTAQTASFNEASNALLQSLGFHRDGILRQHHELDEALYNDHLYSLLRDEFQNSAE